MSSQLLDIEQTAALKKLESEALFIDQQARIEALAEAKKVEVESLAVVKKLEAEAQSKRDEAGAIVRAADREPSA